MKKLSAENVNVDVLSYFLANISDKLLVSLRNLNDKNVFELTEDEIFAIALMARCEIEFETVSPETGQYEYIIKIKNKITVNKDKNGKFFVLEYKK